MSRPLVRQTRLYWIHALTPLHVGSGRGVGYIDLPLMRETLTNWPVLPGSAFKGVLADYFGATDKKRKEDAVYRAAFGINDPEQGAEMGANSGSLAFTDARLVCLPVRSLYGTFAWCTSAIALRRLHRDLEWTGLADGLSVPNEVAEGRVRTAASQDEPTVLCGQGRTVYCEDLDFQIDEDQQETNIARSWALKLGQWIFPDEADWQKEFRRRFAVLPDDAFNFLCETATQVDARVRIDGDRKTVREGALWYEESLPPETVLAGLVWCDRLFADAKTRKALEAVQVGSAQLLEKFCAQAADEALALQIGGKATVGRGQVRAVFTKGA